MTLIRTGGANQRVDFGFVRIEHYHYWILKDPSLPTPLAPWLLNIPLEPINLNETSLDNGVVDPTGEDEDP